MSPCPNQTNSAQPERGSMDSRARSGVEHLGGYPSTTACGGGLPPLEGEDFLLGVQFVGGVQHADG
jgi:hypothetical protein